jgi:hypothetical protein
MSEGNKKVSFIKGNLLSVKGEKNCIVQQVNCCTYKYKGLSESIKKTFLMEIFMMSINQMKEF